MDRFAAAREAAARDLGCRGIGTLGEKSLHLTLKYYFAPDADSHEQTVGGFIADAVTEEGIYEIQTRALSRLKPKLDAFLPCCPVTVVHPVVTEKYLCSVDANGELTGRRRSPKHESPYTAMREIYTLRDYIGRAGFRIGLCMVSLDEYVRKERAKRTKLDRVPTALHEIIMLESPADYAALLPDAIPEPFTVSDIAAAVHAPEMQTRLFLTLLARLGILEECCRTGRYKQWQRSFSDTIRG